MCVDILCGARATWKQDLDDNISVRVGGVILQKDISLVLDLALEGQLPMYWVPVLKSLYTIYNPRTYYMGTRASRVR